jgi:hypothetical protein
VRARYVLLSLLLASCTSHSAAGPSATPTEDNPCAGATPAPGCVTSTPAAGTAYPYPADAGGISPLPVPDKFEGELARKDNNVNPGTRNATIVVTIPAGKVVASDVLCQGRGEVIVTTQPRSQAEQTISCDGNSVPSQLGVFASSPEKVATRYVFTLRATGPSRWLLAVSARVTQHS